MARITVEDCIDKFPSRFELVLVASNRARKLHSGETPTIEKDNDKNTVIALREIAEETITKDQLQNELIEEYQTTSFTEDEEINELEDKKEIEETNDNQDEINQNSLEENEDNSISDNAVNDENLELTDSESDIDNDSTDAESKL